MKSFGEWLKETYYGHIIHTNFDNDEFMQTRVNSNRLARVAFKDMSPDKANCKYLKIGCKKGDQKSK